MRWIGSGRSVSLMVAGGGFLVTAWDYLTPSPSQSEVWATGSGLWVAGFGLAGVLAVASSWNAGKHPRIQQAAAVVAAVVLVGRGVAIKAAFWDANAAMAVHISFGFVVASSWAYVRTTTLLADGEKK